MSLLLSKVGLPTITPFKMYTRLVDCETALVTSRDTTGSQSYFARTYPLERPCDPRFEIRFARNIILILSVQRSDVRGSAGSS